MSDVPPHAKIAALLADATFEISPGDDRGLAILAEMAPAGTGVMVAYPPKRNDHDVVAMARAVRTRGLRPVPHLPARAIPSRTRLDDFVARLAGDAGVESVLAIGGDAAHPAGPFAETLDVIETGTLARHAIRDVGMAVHPEGHPRVSAAVLSAALVAKLAALRERGHAAWLVSQFCFEAAPIIRLSEELRRLAPGVTLRVGIAGPAGIATLLRFAVRCGVGNSLRALRTRPDSLTRLLGDHRPDALLAELAAASPAIEALHVFPFGGLAETKAWIEAGRLGVS